MVPGKRLLIALIASCVLHLVMGAVYPSMQPPPPQERYTVKMRIEQPPVPLVEPEPEPEKVLEPPPPKPRPRRVRRRKAEKPPEKPPEQVLPQPLTPAPPDAPPARPRFGISMASTSALGSGPAMAVGNTLDPSAPIDPNPTREPESYYAPPPPVETVTRMPRMKGSCRGAYTARAREAGLEGTVVLSLVVDPSGRARDIKVRKGLGMGLSEAAVDAVKRCRFSPGSRADKAVSVRLPAFKIRFLLDLE